MIRLLKFVGTANLAVAILVVICYTIWGLLFGLPIDQQFLAWGPGYLGTPSGEEISPWVLTLVAEAVVVVGYVVFKYKESDMKGHRLFCAVMSLVGGWMLVSPMLPNYPDEVLPELFIHFDHALALYVWSSHLIYALIGPNDD